MQLPQTNLFPERVRTIFECQPLFPTAQGWQLAVLVSCVIGVLVFSLWMTLRDSRQLSRPVRTLLIGLRLIALAGILIYVINPVQRTETRLVKDSRVAILVDTSLSMGLSDQLAGPAADQRRIDEVINWLQQTDAIQQLQTQHEVSVYRFGESAQPELIATFSKRHATKPTDIDENPNVNVGDSNDAARADANLPIAWKTELTPQGTSTELGSALQFIINKERGGPIAGLVVVTDGRSNAGIPPLRAVAAANSGGIPIFPVGIGSNTAPRNLKIVDVQTPSRVFPGDKFFVKGVIKATGIANTTIAVQLFSVDENSTEAETLEDEITVRLLEDGLSVPVSFSTSQITQGKRRYIIRVPVIAGEQDPRDNERGSVVEIVDRQTKVLLIAGGPTREFRFLRNQLYRDSDVLLHVWLQSAPEGADQESDRLLTEFPTTREQLFEFDCIVAFDPDWRDLSAEQASLLERWVAEQAGGLIVVAGPVNTPEWTRRPRGDETVDQIRRLYPVSFFSQGTAQLKLGRFGGEEDFPLGFTREGRAAEFLWLGDTASESQVGWDRFSGVFGYYAVNEPKSGADVLANFADPTTAVDGRLPIYLASHYYGAGRVVFQASGEMWRIRRLDVGYFQQYYTKMIRWASAGRLLRDSTRGVLLADRERCWMGDQVSVQAILRTVQDQPLLVPEVNASIKKPDGSIERLVLRATENAVRPGTFTANFTATSEGTFRVSLPIPNSSELEMLSTSVEASIPDLEQEKPQRNDELLSQMAEKTAGHYYIGTQSFSLPQTDPLSPAQLMQPQDQITFLTGTPNQEFHRRLMMWLMGIVTFALALEWTLRRLNKLA